MKASEFFTRPLALNVRALPSLDALERAVRRIAERWPDAVNIPLEQDREKLALEMKRRVSEWDWAGLKTAQITSAAVAVFDRERRDRDDLKEVREFYLEEICAHEPGAFLDAMAWVYIDSFDERSQHTIDLATTLTERSHDLGPRITTLLEVLPKLFVPGDIGPIIAERMMVMDSPYDDLKKLGFRSPHTSGLTLSAHQKFVSLIASSLKQDAPRKRLLKWLIPSEGKPLLTGAQKSVEALLKPWASATPPDEIRTELTETIISAYRDPRLHSGGIWAGFDAELKEVLLRWLTKQDMQFFCDSITATQDSHMWPPRRDFWLELYEEGRIDAAWVAFGAQARTYARQMLLRNNLDSSSRRFGRQMDRPNDGGTSLLIMKIGNKIVVDGCHSYKTHIFRQDDRGAPKLYQSIYHCDDIMRRSKLNKAHISIKVWSEWVERHV